MNNHNFKQKAKLLLEKKQFDYAYRLFEQACKQDPLDQEARHGLRLAAIQKTPTSSLLSPLSKGLYKALGFCQKTLDNKDAAFKHYERAFLRSPRKEQGLWQLLAIAEKHKQNRVVYNLLQEILTLNPQSTKAQRILAKLYTQAGQLQEAQGLYETLQKQLSHDGEFQSELKNFQALYSIQEGAIGQKPAAKTPAAQEKQPQEQPLTNAHKAIVLCSGGLDSSTILAMAKQKHQELYALTFNYGQRHNIELELAQKVAKRNMVKEHKVIQINLRDFGGSSLTSSEQVHKHDDGQTSQGIPNTYVPARNTIFLSYALAWAEVLGCSHIYIGVNSVDYSGYPDCRGEYIAAFERMANLATKAGVEGQGLTIHTPLLQLSKGQIIKQGLELGVDYSLTHSCYDPDENGKPCEKCDSCILRARGFQEAGLTDPAL